MKTLHTKGEWTVQKDGNLPSGSYQTTIYGEKNENEVAITWAETEEESVANAKLIASSPELLDALKIVKDYIDYPHTHKGTTRIRKSVEKAIKKATE